MTWQEDLYNESTEAEREEFEKMIDSEKNRDLFLCHKFTDRGGSEVYDAFSADDRLAMKKVLFEIRIDLKKDFDLAEVTVLPGAGKVNGHGTG